MFYKKFLSKKMVAVFGLAFVLGSALSGPMKAMEFDATSQKSMVQKKRCCNGSWKDTYEFTQKRCTKNRTCGEIMHNIYNEPKRLLLRIWNFFNCKGCKYKEE